MRWVRQPIGVGIDDPSSLSWATDEPASESDAAANAIRLRSRRDLPLPEWVEPVVDRILELEDLPLDARGSCPLNAEDVRDALNFLDRVMRSDTILPWVGRLSSGGVQLNWHQGDVEVEAVFDGLRGEREVVLAVGDNEWSEPTEQAESLFATVVDRLSNTFLEQPANNRAT
jgi:hypothetical protein